MRRGSGELRPGLDLRELSIRLAVPWVVYVVPGCAMMIVVPMLDGSLVEGGLLWSRMRST